MLPRKLLMASGGERGYVGVKEQRNWYFSTTTFFTLQSNALPNDVIFKINTRIRINAADNTGDPSTLISAGSLAFNDLFVRTSQAGTYYYDAAYYVSDSTPAFQSYTPFGYTDYYNSGFGYVIRGATSVSLQTNTAIQTTATVSIPNPTGSASSHYIAVIAAPRGFLVTGIPSEFESLSALKSGAAGDTTSTVYPSVAVYYIPTGSWSNITVSVSENHEYRVQLFEVHF